MNKTHWNSIILDGSVPDKDIRRMIGESYDLTKGKKKHHLKGPAKRTEEDDHHMVRRD